MKKKLIIYLFGGLGNNLFQMAFADNLSEDYDIIYNTYFQKKNFLTKLFGWSIHPTDVLEKVLESEKTCDTINIVDIFYLCAVFFMSKINKLDIFDVIKLPVFCGRCFSYGQKNVIISKEFLSNLRVKIFNLNYNDKLQKQFFKNVIHIRRGDFSQDIQLDMDFYKKAIYYSNCKEFIVVTNDHSVIHELKLVFPYINFELSVGRSQLDDFLIMSKANLLILSNSTFSYWSSQIGIVKLIIYPSKIKKNRFWTFPLINNKSIKVDSFFYDTIG